MSSCFRPSALISGPVLGGLPGPGINHYIIPNYQARNGVGYARFTVVAIRTPTAATEPGDGWIALRATDPRNDLAPLYGDDWNAGNADGSYNMGDLLSVAFGNSVADTINAFAAPFYIDSPPRPFATTAAIRGEYPGLKAEVLDSSGMLTYGPVMPLGHFSASKRHGPLVKPGQLMDVNYNLVIDYVAAAGTIPTLGATVYLAVTPKHFSADWPMCFAGHPAGLIQGALEWSGVAVDAATVDDVADQLGTQLCFVGQLTNPSMSVQQFVESIGGLAGITTQYEPSTQLRRLVAFREPIQAAPTDIITDDNIYPNQGRTFDLSNDFRCNSVKFDLVQLERWRPGLRRPLNDVVVRETPMVWDYKHDGVTADKDIYGEQQMTFGGNGVQVMVCVAAG